jgi:hypothetical protein
MADDLEAFGPIDVVVIGYPPGAPFIAAVRRNGGVLIANERIGVQALIDALDAVEATA